jgi:hypothetical protein
VVLKLTITKYELCENGILKKTGEEIVEDEKLSQPTKMDILEAQVTYTAMMTDTLLEV